MNSDDAIAVLVALGQATRLETFRLLVRAIPDGMPAGDIAASLDIPRNTMSSHLNILANAGLVQSVRSSRQIIYSADPARLQGLTSFLMEECCGGHPELCAPANDAIRTTTCGSA